MLQWFLLCGTCGLWQIHDRRYNEITRSVQSPIDLSTRATMTLREWQRMLKTEAALIVQASKQDGSDGWQPYPVGMSYAFLLHEYKPSTLQSGTHQDLVLCAISPQTDGRRRPGPPNRESILRTLVTNGISNRYLDGVDYFEALPQHKFIISPEGNGIDCHRHYEALIAGSIPVVEYNEDIRRKYGDCPILYTNNSYQDITPTYLETIYHGMLDRTFDFSRLLLTFYDESIQKQIKAEGNHWCEKLAGRRWYTAES